MSYAADGSLNVTTVDGTSYVGLFAADGSLNVIEESGFGAYHPSGALRVTTVPGTSVTGVYAADGSLNVTNAESDGASGLYHPCGAIRMTGLFSVLSLSPHMWYDPSDLSTLFQDAAMTTPVTATDDPVGAVLDKSGNGHHLIQSTANARPLYKTSGGLHWLEFDGAGDFLVTAVEVAHSQPWERLSAFRSLEAIGATNRILLVESGGTFDGQLYFTTVSEELRIHSGVELGGLSAPATNADFVATERHNGANSRVAIDNGVYQEGDAGTETTTGIQVNTSGQPSFNCRWYGTVMFDRSLNDSEIAQLRTYLAAKQGRVL